MMQVSGGPTHWRREPTKDFGAFGTSANDRTHKLSCGNHVTAS